MYDDILFPFDGSEGATEILDHAVEIARWANATIHVLFVADTNRESVAVVQGQAVDALVRHGEDIVDEAAARLDEVGVAYDTDVVQGSPAASIVAYAERYDHDLIVMPTHGHEGISRFLLGSVSEKVVRLSGVPVLSARMQPDEQLVFPYEDILVPTDGSATATRAAEHGLSLAAALDATVHVLSVVDDTAVGPHGESIATDQDADLTARDIVEDVVAKAETQGVEHAVTHVEHGNPIEVILDSIGANDIHAVVMGTTGRRGTERILLGSVAERTVRSAPVPVVSVGSGE